LCLLCLSEHLDATCFHQGHWRLFGHVKRTVGSLRVGQDGYRLQYFSAVPIAMRIGARSAGHQLRDIGGLDARRMPGPDFGPVPRTSAARIQLEVLPASKPSTSMRPKETRTIRGGRFYRLTTVSTPSSVCPATARGIPPDGPGIRAGTSASAMSETRNLRSRPQLLLAAAWVLAVSRTPVAECSRSVGGSRECSRSERWPDPTLMSLIPTEPGRNALMILVLRSCNRRSRPSSASAPCPKKRLRP
jgi:hypothetical protein